MHPNEFYQYLRDPIVLALRRNRKTLRYIHSFIWLMILRKGKVTSISYCSTFLYFDRNPIYDPYRKGY